MDRELPFSVGYTVDCPFSVGWEMATLLKDIYIEDFAFTFRDTVD
jgi:hypothetical protein